MYVDRDETKKETVNTWVKLGGIRAGIVEKSVFLNLFIISLTARK